MIKATLLRERHRNMAKCSEVQDTRRAFERVREELLKQAEARLKRAMEEEANRRAK